MKSSTLFHRYVYRSAVFSLIAIVALPCKSEEDPSPIDMLPGIARPARQAELACATEGVLRAMHVSEGQWVNEEQLVATLDDSIARASVHFAQKEADQTAAIQLAKLRLDESKGHLERVERLSSHRAASDVELDQAKYDVLKLQAEYDRAIEAHQLALARLEQEKVRLDACQVHAPFAGHVLSIEKQLGEFVSSEDAILLVADSTELKIDLYVPWTYHSTIQESETYTLISDTLNGQLISATCKSIERKVDPSSGTFRCTFLIDNSSLNLPTGFAARLCLSPNPQR